jgi:TorA maturation chaperone TorD
VGANGAIAAVEGVANVVSPEESLRARHYQLLARFLAAPPDAELLHLSAGFEGDDTPLGQALAELARQSAGASPETAAKEYFELFIGLGRGELVPYGSFYLTGFLNEKPLAKLRLDMSRLGIARADGVKEPEDHIAAICEMMAGMITGAFGAPLDLHGQQAFFDAHLAPWGERFFEDLESAKTAAFYRPVGTLGRRFLEIETVAFEMAA